MMNLKTEELLYLVSAHNKLPPIYTASDTVVATNASPLASTDATETEIAVADAEVGVANKDVNKQADWWVADTKTANIKVCNGVENNIQSQRSNKTN